MKTFEVSSQKSKSGMREFKLVLHEIYPDDCVDSELQEGTLYNRNGITWIEEYCNNSISSMKDKSLRVEFVDNDDRIEVLGHGETGTRNGMPEFKNATVIGHFTDAYIDTIVDNGVEKRVAIGVGMIDEMCYPDFVEKLIEDSMNGNAPFGSVEICKTEQNNSIIYKYGYKEFGRIPTEFVYSGYALLGVMPADDSAKLLEINKAEMEDHKMDHDQIKAIVSETLSVIAEANKCKEECEAAIAEANAQCQERDTKINELNEVIVAKDEEICKCNSEREAVVAENEALKAEINALKEEIDKVKADKKIGELNEAISEYSDEEKAYAQAEIDAFNADPLASEINSVVDKILVGIGRKAKENEKIVSEQNSAKDKVEDIFAEVGGAKANDEEDDSIF